MKAINSISLLLILAVILLQAGCAPTPPPTLEESPPQDINRVPQDESFDPLEFPDDETITLPPSELQSKPSTSASINESERDTAVSFETVEVSGYRVQLFTTNVEFEARSVEEKALIEFDQNVYLIFDSPIYKIRIGDCLTRTEANKLRQVAVKRGYRGAWVVQSKVTVTEPR
ncbi:hypothetical protein CEE37_01275 [candidate division LCP-89 bacterium B3_LCP]|uniref:SPOR domain-containing protein n=1 Tax=candidate division LCP-89 bacterium B3_LCP TaxID=2012998 RepID=A0A532V579_UNCL8|nr:MAG: hypothetical protein CEE37_01275 [candidate division LCP-89 bacterium B3_LCP]